MPDLTGPGPGALQTITVLVVDAVGSTALMSSIGHDRGERMINEEIDRLVGVAGELGGFLIKNLGDGVMVGFGSAAAALDAAAQMHRTVAALDDEHHLDQHLRIRIAAAVSDVVIDEDVYGAALIHAARAEKLVPAGQTWCTEAVRLLARGRGAHEFEPMGGHEFRGIDEPVVLHRVRTPLGDRLGMPPALDGTRRFGFVGRHHEFERLLGDWRATAAGAGRLVTVTGAPGLGKTRLCRELAVTVRESGAVVLHGRCPEDAGEPFAPFVQMLRTVAPHVRDTPTLMGRGVAELARLVPELRSGTTEVGAPSDVDASTDRHLLFDAFTAWLQALSARTPVLAVIDDCHWADEPSAQLLRHIARGIGADPVMIVASYRRVDAPAAIRGILGDRDVVADSTRLTGLDDDAVVAFVEALLGRPLDETGRATAVRIGAHVGGNPLFLGEVVPQLVTEEVLVERVPGVWSAGDEASVHLPAAIEEAVSRRVGRESAACQDVLRLAALIGFEFSAELLVELAAGSPVAVAQALEEAVAADLVRHTGDHGGCEFAHAVIRQAIYDGISPTVRAAEHRRIGEAIELQFADQPERWIEQLAYHFEQGLGWRDAAKAIEYLRRAGAVASERLAHDHAVELYLRAQALGERWERAASPDVACDILLELGTAQRRSGSDSAGATLMRASALAVAMGDAARATAAVLALGRGVFSVSGTLNTERVAMLRQALELVGPSATVPRARLLATLSSELLFDSDPTAAEAANDEALAIAREIGDLGLLVTVLGNRMVALWRVDRIDERLATADELEVICARAGRERRGKLISVMTACCQVAMEAGQFDRADRLLEWIDDTAETLHQPMTVAYAKLRVASRAMIAGRLDEAEAIADEAYRLSIGQPDAGEFHVGQQFVVRFHRGRTAEVVDALERSAAHFPGIVALSAGVVAAAAEMGDLERCRRGLDPLLEDLPALRCDLNWLTTIALMTYGVRALRDRPGAAALREAIEPYRGLFVDNASAFFGSVWLYDALLATVLGDEAGAIAGYRRALAEHERLSSPTWLARTHAELAVALAEFGDESAAAAHATTALRLGREWGLGRVVELAGPLAGTLPVREPELRGPGSEGPGSRG